MNIIIIGGDAAGMSAASRIKRNKPDFRVKVLEKTNDVSYSACGMPYNIADRKRDIEDLVVRQAAVFREKQGIHLLTGHCAERIDPSIKSVLGTTSEGKPFQFPYDTLVIATGASPIIPDLPGFDLPGVLALIAVPPTMIHRSWLMYDKSTKTVDLLRTHTHLGRSLALDSSSRTTRPAHSGFNHRIVHPS